MPLQLSVGFSKKQGLPDYGSIGASCHVTIELDGSLLHQDLATFHQQAKNAYVACRQAVNDELARQQTADDNGAGNGAGTPGPHDRPRETATLPRHVGSGGNGQPATQKQLDYLHQLARQVRGLGVRRLETLAQHMAAKPLAELTSLDASSLIDAVKAIKEGRLSLDAAMKGAAA